MTGILDRIRATTADQLENVSGDFSDLLPTTARRATPKEMIRTVEGADDLRHPKAGIPSAFAGMSKVQDWSGDDSPMAREARCLECQGFHAGGASCAPMIKTGASERQVELIKLRLTWLAEIDADGAAAMTGWLTRGGWATLEGGRGGSASSQLIDRIKARHEAKKAELAAANRPTYGNDTEFQVIPNGYYALELNGTIHYFRVSRFRDGGVKLQEQASDELHPVRRGARRDTILRGIIAFGPGEASALYGRTIGRCGRCNRTLTDAESRARGIGPDCWGKM